MTRPTDEELYAQLEAARVEMWRTLGRRQLKEDEERHVVAEKRRAHFARKAARERAVAIAVALLFGLLVVIGLGNSGGEESPCTLTAVVGYPECVEDLGPGFRFEWPWSRAD